MDAVKQYIMKHETGQSNYCDSCIALHWKRVKMVGTLGRPGGFTIPAGRKPWKKPRKHCGACGQHDLTRRARYEMKRQLRKEAYESPSPL